MATNYGKSFEQVFKKDFLKLDNSTIDRLYDTQNGFKSISQVCDFIGYVYPNIFYLECKSIHGNTFPLTNLTQYAKLKEKVGIKGVRAGVIIWFVDHDKIVYVPTSTFTKLHENQEKSFNINKTDPSLYKYYIIPTTKKQVFVTGDYSLLLNTLEGE